jgi:hypothetical protein
MLGVLGHEPPPAGPGTLAEISTWWAASPPGGVEGAAAGCAAAELAAMAQATASTAGRRSEACSDV